MQIPRSTRNTSHVIVSLVAASCVSTLVGGCSRPAAGPAPLPPQPAGKPQVSEAVASRNPLSGTWLAAEPGQSSVNGPKITLKFDDHGGLVETMSAGGESVVLKSTYKTDGNKLTERFVSLTGIDAQVPKTDRVKTFQFKVEGDTLSLTQTPANNVMVFTRVMQPDSFH